jgi:alpha-maltose-1-phosphate synthase
MVTPQLLACDIPVIATTNTGAEEVVKNDYNGYIVEIRNTQAITSKIEHLYSNRDLLTQMKSNAVKSVFQNFKWDDYEDRYIKFLKSKINF